MSRTPLKVAIVGTNIGCNLHVRALRGAGFDVTTLVGRDKDRTAARAGHFRIPHAGTSFDAVLESDVDGVVVATPPATHHPFTMRAIGAGKHMLCEKPFALDIGQAREMRDAARDTGVVGQVVHPNRWHGFRAALRDLVRTGELGDPLQASFNFDHFMLARDMDGLPDWWLDSATGGGWLRNYAGHGIDPVRSRTVRSCAGPQAGGESGRGRAAGPGRASGRRLGPAVRLLDVLTQDRDGHSAGQSGEVRRRTTGGSPASSGGTDLGLLPHPPRGHARELADQFRQGRLGRDVDDEEAGMAALAVELGPPGSEI